MELIIDPGGELFLEPLYVKSKTCFINGKIVSPNLDDPSFQQWEIW